MSGHTKQDFPFTALERRLIEALVDLCAELNTRGELNLPKGHDCRTPLGRAYRHAMDTVAPCLAKGDGS